jgi:hypothetical protein
MTGTHCRIVPAILILIVSLLAGCSTTPAPDATATMPGPTVTTPAPAATLPVPTATAPEPAPPSANPWVSLLGAVTTPPGWTVEPCEGPAPFLCVSSGDAFPGSVELFQYPLDQHEDAQQWLVEAGLEPGRLPDFDDPEQASRARQVLHNLRADHMGVVEEDRMITYPEGRTFVLLDPEEVQVGRLPGLFYGFAGVDEDGQTYERWLTYAATDGRDFFILTAFYDPSDTPGSLPSDEALLTFAPYLRDIVAGLQLP